MIRPAPPAVIGLAALMLAASAAHTGATGVNLLQPAGRSPQRILIDASATPWDDDDAAAMHDGECIAVADPEQRAASDFGAVSWTRGRLAWEWHRGSEPSIVYLVCLDRDPSRSAAGGSGMALFAALSWAHARATSRAATLAPGATPAQTSFEIGPSPLIAWPGTGDGDTADDPLPPVGTIASEPVLLDFPIAMPASGDSEAPRPPPSAIGRLDPPALIINPGDTSPVPEPSTWLLVGTGVAAAWRAARNR